MNTAEAIVFAREIAPVFRRMLDDAIRPIESRLAAIEARPAPKDGVGVKGTIRDHAGCLVFTLTDGNTMSAGEVKDGAPGRDADPEMVRKVVDEAIAERPAPKDGENGKDADPQAVAALLKAEIGPRIEALQVSIDRIEAAAAAAEPVSHRGDSRVAEPEALREAVVAEVARVVAELPPAKDGTPGEPGPAGKDGADGKDGVGMAGLVIDRDDNLVATLSNGSTVKLGCVVGRDGKDGAPGRDGFGFDDLSVEHDGERGLQFCFARGDQIKVFPIVLPAHIDRGVWRDGEYAKGDVVSYAGSMFVAQCDTSAKPEDGSTHWRLAVKRGRDGKDGAPGKKGDPGPKGKDGTYLSERPL